MSVTIEGEGPQYDPSGGGMTGTTIQCTHTDAPGFAVSRGVQVIFRGFTLAGAYDYITSANPLALPDNWDIDNWKDPALDSTNWLGGTAVNVGIAFEPYSGTNTYPARNLPAEFGGGTTSADISIGGTDFLIEDVNVDSFVIGVGRPVGDSNSEFIRIIRGSITRCVYGVTIGHSQARNTAILNTNFNSCHTCITNVGGTLEIANLHGTYIGIHVGQCYQIIAHDNAGYSGPISFQDLYAEGLHRIGTVSSTGNCRSLNFDGCFISLVEQTGTNGVPENHLEGGSVKISIRNSYIGVRDHLIVNLYSLSASLTLDNSVVTNASSVEVLTGNAQLFSNFHSNRILGGMLNDQRVVVSHAAGPATSPYYQSSTFSTVMLDASAAEINLTHTGQRNAVYSSLGQGVAASGAVTQHAVPQIFLYSVSVTVTSRSGYDLTCTRPTYGNLKADLGDVFYLSDNSAPGEGWFVVQAISGSDMTLRQVSNYYSTTTTNYFTNGRAQVEAGTYDTSQYYCSRICQNSFLTVGAVTSGSEIITNCKNAMLDGNGWSLSGSVQMVAGDYFIHTEIERANVGGSSLNRLNLIADLDEGAQTITLTDDFNLTAAAYPVVFFVKVFNA